MCKKKKSNELKHSLVADKKHISLVFQWFLENLALSLNAALENTDEYILCVASFCCLKLWNI